MFQNIKKRIKVKCAICSKIFEDIPSHAKNRKTCSKKCFRAWISKKLYGIKRIFTEEHKKAIKIGQKEFYKTHHSYNWNGGRHQNHGYFYVYKPDHPFATKLGYVFEHRLVMEKHIGRYLKPKERVHHINQNTIDNRTENLQLFETTGHHYHFHKRLKN